MRWVFCSFLMFCGLLCPASSEAQTLQGRLGCKAAIKSKDRARAIEVCKASLKANTAPEEMTDLVHAYMLGDGPLSPQDLYEAVILSRGAGRWGDYYSAIARCHLAKRLGDEAMIDTCTETLKERYLKHADAQETLAEVKADMPWSIAAAWLVLVAGLLGTAAHWTLRRIKARSSAVSAIVAAVVLLCLPSSHSARAQEGKPIDIDIPNRFPIDDQNPSSNIPTEAQRNQYPMDFGYFLQENLDRAERATKGNRHADAAKYFYAVAAAVPDVAIGFTKLCESLEKAGQIKEAIVACKGALSRSGSKVSDHARLAQLIFSQPDPLPQAQIDDIVASVAHLKKEGDTTKDNQIKAVGFDLECDVAKRTKNKKLLAECAAGLATLNPNTARAISLQWAVAVNNNDKPAAERWVALASQQKLSADVIDMMKQGTASLKPPWRRALADWRVLMMGVVTVGLILAVAFRRRFNLRQRLA